MVGGAGRARVPGGAREQKEEGLLRAVELAPRVKDELGQGWLDESFTKAPERGMEILSTVGTLVSQGIPSRPFGTDERLNALKLMKTAVEALLKAAPDRAKEWRPTLTLLAAGGSRGRVLAAVRPVHRQRPSLRRDMYGNIFFGNDDEDPYQRMMMMQRPDQPRRSPPPRCSGRPERGVGCRDRRRVPPEARRREGPAAPEGVRGGEGVPAHRGARAAQPDDAKELVKEFVRVWTRNHDPNANRNQNRYSWYFFAFEQRAESIPLTARSRSATSATSPGGLPA